jgi:serine protease inhibitor
MEQSKNVCSFIKHGAKKVLQWMVPCHDCLRRTQNNYVCIGCSRRCHLNHRLGEEKKIVGVCQCGLNRLCRNSDIAYHGLDSAITPGTQVDNVIMSRQLDQSGYKFVQKPLNLTDRSLFGRGTRGDDNLMEEKDVMNDVIYGIKMKTDNAVPTNRLHEIEADMDPRRDFQLNEKEETYPVPSLKPDINDTMLGNCSRCYDNLEPYNRTNIRASQLPDQPASMPPSNYFSLLREKKMKENINDMSYFVKEPSETGLEPFEAIHSAKGYQMPYPHSLPKEVGVNYVTPQRAYQTAPIGMELQKYIPDYPENKEAHVIPEASCMPIDGPIRLNMKVGGNFSDTTNTFGLGLLQQYLYQLPNKKLVLSPYSISAILYCLYKGTHGKTETELRTFLNCGTREMIFSGTVYMHQNLVRTNTFNIRNVLVANNIPIRETYKMAIEPIMHVCNQLNGSDMIMNLLPHNSINANTRLIILSTNFFKSKWKYGFMKSMSKPEPFYSISKGTNTPSSTSEFPHVTMMTLSGSYQPYTEDDSYQLIEIQCAEDNYRFGILLPKNNASYVYLPWDKLITYIKSLRTKEIDLLRIPKFKQTSKFIVSNMLKSMGLRNLFGEGDLLADLTRISNMTNVNVTSIIQQISVTVDETGLSNGFESTYIVNKGFKNGPSIFIANHPFMYYLRHVPSNLLLFSGCYS